MIKLSSILYEVVQGQGHMTANKFASICLQQLKNSIDGEITLYDSADLVKEKDKYNMPSRVLRLNSSLRCRFHIETNNKMYFLNIVNEFKKVPDEELTDKFTMRDDDYLINMPSVSLEPKDLNIQNKLMTFGCSLIQQDDEGNTIRQLIPEKEQYAVYFKQYMTISSLIKDVRETINDDRFNDLGKLNESEDESEDEFDVSLLNSINDITDIVMNDMVKAAQEQYDDWRQDHDGQDDELGRGGICHLIADDLIDVLYRHKIENVQSVCSNYEQHVYVVGQFKEGIYEIDIPYDVYETGGGFTWKKIPNVQFSRNDIVIRRLSSDPSEYSNYVDSI